MTTSVVRRYKVIGHDLATGFHGVGLNEAWLVLEPYIRREREIRKMGYVVFYEDLVCRFRSRPPAKVYGKLRLRRLAADESSGDRRRPPGAEEQSAT